MIFPQRTGRRIVKLRVARQLGPARIGFRMSLPPSAVYAVITRYGCPPLAHLDRATGQPVRHYERAAPGELVHVDIKKLGNIPDGGGWRVTGRAQGRRNKIATAGTSRSRHHHPLLGYSYLHTAIDDCSRLAYSEILADERKEPRSRSGSAPTPGVTPSPRPGSPTSASAPTGPRPTARPNASTAPCWTSGPTPAPTAPKPNAAPL